MNGHGARSEARIVHHVEFALRRSGKGLQGFGPDEFPRLGIVAVDFAGRCIGARHQKAIAPDDR